jgi:hypothetical protein
MGTLWGMVSLCPTSGRQECPWACSAFSKKFLAAKKKERTFEGVIYSFCLKVSASHKGWQKRLHEVL